nr:MAG TPA: hypothetical protein [Caudoviricetes sp.]
MYTLNIIHYTVYITIYEQLFIRIHYILYCIH